MIWFAIATFHFFAPFLAFVFFACVVFFFFFFFKSKPHSIIFLSSRRFSPSFNFISSFQYQYYFLSRKTILPFVLFLIYQFLSLIQHLSPSPGSVIVHHERICWVIVKNTEINWFVEIFFILSIDCWINGLKDVIFDILLECHANMHENIHQNKPNEKPSPEWFLCR